MEERDLLRILETAFIHLKKDINYKETKRKYQQALEEIVALMKKPKVDKRFIEEWYPAINYLAHSDEAKEEHKGILRRMLEKAGVEVIID